MYIKISCGCVAVREMIMCKTTTTTTKTIHHNNKIVKKGKKKMKCNVRVRKELEARRIRQWELAKKMEIDEGTLCRKLRVELSEEEQDRLIAIIQDIQKEGV